MPFPCEPMRSHIPDVGPSSHVPDVGPSHVPAYGFAQYASQGDPGFQYGSSSTSAPFMPPEQNVYRPHFNHPTIYPQPLHDWDWGSPPYNDPKGVFSSLDVPNVPSCFLGEPFFQVFDDSSGSQLDLDLNASPSAERVHFGMLGGEPDSTVGRNARPLRPRVVCRLAGCTDHGYDHIHRDQSR